jgi:hypothetical protein
MLKRTTSAFAGSWQSMTEKWGARRTSGAAGQRAARMSAINYTKSLKSRLFAGEIVSIVDSWVKFKKASYG